MSIRKMEFLFLIKIKIFLDYCSQLGIAGDLMTSFSITTLHAVVLLTPQYMEKYNKYK